MNSEMTDLAREAVACDGWRWMRGIPAQASLKGEQLSLVCLGSSGEYIADFYCSEFDERWGSIHADEQRELDILPDFDHPLAVQALLDMVREAWGEPDASAHRGAKGWTILGVRIRIGGMVKHHPTEAAALVAALKAGGSQ